MERQQHTRVLLTYLQSDSGDRQRRHDLDAAASPDEAAITTAAPERVPVGLALPVLGGRRLLEDPLDLTLDRRARLVERLLPVELLEGVHLAVVGGGDVRVGNLEKGTKGPWELDFEWRGGEGTSHFAAEAVCFNGCPFVNCSNKKNLRV